MSDNPKVNYGGVEIEHRDDRWYFEIDGKECASEKLSTAKARIDDGPKEKKAPVKKYKAYLLNSYGTVPSIVEVGAQVENPASWRNSVRFWVTQNGKRSQESHDSLFKINDANDSAFTRIDELVAERAKIDAEITNLKNGL